MKKIRYYLDNLLSQKPKLLIVFLVLSTITILSVIALLIDANNPHIDAVVEDAVVENAVAEDAVVEDATSPNTPKSDGFLKIFEKLINIALSPSVQFGNDTYLSFILFIFVAVLGLLFISVLISILTSIIETKLTNLRRGKSLVVESNHSVFLGWSNKLITAVHELAEANSSQSKSRIVVMSLKDKIFMEECLLREIPKKSNTKVICRSGDPSDLRDLNIISPTEARSIVLLAADDVSNDSQVLKRALALQKNVLITCPIIAEINSGENAEALKLFSKITVIQPRNFIMRIIAQAIKAPGLIAVFSELLTYKGKEIYFWPETDNNDIIIYNDKFEEFIVGKSFDEAVFEFENGCVIGVLSEYSDLENKKSKQVNLLPKNDYKIKSTDRLILIDEDDSLIGNSLGNTDFKAKFKSDLQIKKVVNSNNKRHITIIGWHSWGDILLNELEVQLTKGSEVDIFYNPDLSEGIDENLPHLFKNISLKLIKIKEIKKETIKMFNWERTDSIIILGCRDKLGIQEADSLTLLIFTHVKHERDLGTRNINICCEVLDQKNGELIERSREDELIASDELVAKYLIQLSENKYLKAVFTDLLDEAGAVFMLRSSNSYVKPNESIAFGELINIGLLKNELVIGIQFKTLGNSQESKTILAPPKSEIFELHENDKIIVITNN